MVGPLTHVQALIGGGVLPSPPPPQATRQTKVPATNGFAIRTGIPTMQRLLGSVSALQFVTAYSELGGHATPSPWSSSLVRNLVPDPGRRVQFSPRTVRF